jgi:hypothetical protein
MLSGSGSLLSGNGDSSPVEICIRRPGRAPSHWHWQPQAVSASEAAGVSQWAATRRTVTRSAAAARADSRRTAQFEPGGRPCHRTSVHAARRAGIHLRRRRGRCAHHVGTLSGLQAARHLESAGPGVSGWGAHGGSRRSGSRRRKRRVPVQLRSRKVASRRLSA